MTMPQPLRLARWKQVQARALTTIARHGGDRTLIPIPGVGADEHARPWNIRMHARYSNGRSSDHSCPDQGENADADACRSIDLAWHDARLRVRLPSSICEDWLAVRMPDLQIDALPPRFVDAAWDAMVQDAMAGLAVTAMCPGIRVLADGFSRSPAVYPYAWTVSIRSPDAARTVEAELAVDDAGLRRLGDALARNPAPDCGSVPGFLDALSVPLLALVGETLLDAASVGALEVGDVVLFDRCLADPDGEVWLATADGQGVRVRASERGAPRYVVTQEWSSLLMNDFHPTASGYAPEDDPLPRESAYPTDQDATPAAEGYRPPGQPDVPGGDDYPSLAQDGAAAPACAVEPASPGAGPDVDRIPVRLVFDLGEHSMTLGELRRLRAGEFFDLQRPIDAGPVHIRANGTFIGTAELVDIDGRIGARVLTLIPGRDTWA